MAKKPTGSRTGKGARAAADNVHPLPSSGRRRATPVEEPVAFPNVPTIVANAARAAVAADENNRILHWRKDT